MDIPVGAPPSPWPSAHPGRAHSGHPHRARTARAPAGEGARLKRLGLAAFALLAILAVAAALRLPALDRVPRGFQFDERTTPLTPGASWAAPATSSSRPTAGASRC
ncbi:MAG: hypothetical protein U0641_02760 [Anaerolineae bacterium]